MSDNTYFHYTTVSKGYQIITSRCVWLSDYRYLNDGRELHQGYMRFIERLPNSLRAEFDAAFQEHERRHFHCVLSLSTTPTVLSQWRAYAEDGAGIALGFSEMFLHHKGVSLFPGQYESADGYLRNLVDKHIAFVERVTEAPETWATTEERVGWMAGNRDGFNSLVEDLLALKNPAFAEEQEVRAVKSASLGEVKTRVSRNIIVPYLEAEFSSNKSFTDLVISEIWLGPKTPELNRLGLFAIPLPCDIRRYDCGYV